MGMKTTEIETEQVAQVDSPSEDGERKPLHFYVGRLIEKLRLVWLRRRYVLRTMLIVAVASAALAFLLPKRYEATATLMPPGNSGAMSTISMLLGMRGDIGSSVTNQLGDMLGMKSPGQLYIKALQSRYVEDRIIKRFDLMTVYKAKRHIDTRLELEDNTELREDRKSGVITVTVTDSDPNRAAQMANAYSEELDRLLLEMNTSIARREREYYEQQLVAAKAEMQHAAKDLSDFAGKNVAINVPEQGKAAVVAIASVQGQLIAAEAQLKGVLQVYTDGQGPVQSLRAQIAELKRQMAQLGGKEGGGRDAFPDVKKLSALGVPYLDLYQRLKIQGAVVEALSQQYELAKLQESRQVPNVQVMDAAEVPEKKSFPPRILIVILCVWVAFGYAATRVIAAHWWQTAEAGDPWKQVLQPLVALHSLSPKWHGGFWFARTRANRAGDQA